MYNVLVCDDDKAIVKSIEIYLNAQGYKTYPAFNGGEALEIMEKKKIHCIVMDIMMPEMDGISATLKIRKKAMCPSFFCRQKVRIRTKLQVSPSAVTIMSQSPLTLLNCAQG